MNQINWQAVTPQFDQFESSFANLHSIELTHYFELQERALATFRHFTLLSGMARFLVINCCDNPIYRGLVEEGLNSIDPELVVLKTETLSPSHLFDCYSLMLMMTSKSLQDCSLKLVVALSLSLRICCLQIQLLASD